MKIIFYRLFVLFLLVLGTLPAIAVNKIDGIYYNLNSIYKSCSVTSGNIKYSGEVVIPSEITYNGDIYDVTSIGSYAFSGCTGLTSITIPSSVTSIGSYAFSGCTGLTSITIPSSVTKIEDYMFEGCTGLTSITIPSSVTSIGSDAFYRCTDLTSITIPSSVTKIEDYMFRGCTGLTSIAIPSSVTEIGSSAFYGCTGLTSITIPNSVTSIGSSAFDGCTGLKSITIPNSVTSIGSDAFFGCTGLTSITIPSSVTSIGSMVFYRCTGLTSITIPNSVTSIGSEAFKGCTGLKSITIPNSVTSIGSSAFSGCTGLKSVTIDDGSSTLSMSMSSSYEVFSSCPLETLYLGRDLSYSYSPFKGKSTLTSVTIGSSVTEIGSSAFYGCTGLTAVTIKDGTSTLSMSMSSSYEVFSSCPLETLYLGRNLSYKISSYYFTLSDYSPFRGQSTLTSVTIGKSVDEVGEKAFYDCTGLTSVTCYAEEPPTAGDYCFGFIPDDAVLYVPTGTTEKYKSANQWSRFFKIEEVDPNTAIRDVRIDQQSGPTAIFDLYGHKLAQPRRGINIINGKKVLVK